jgi:hypothetical protein
MLTQDNIREPKSPILAGIWSALREREAEADEPWEIEFTASWTNGSTVVPEYLTLRKFVPPAVNINGLGICSVLTKYYIYLHEENIVIGGDKQLQLELADPQCFGLLTALIK